MMIRRFALTLLVLLPLLSSCSSVYYTTMEKFGKEKRHLLRDNVEEARDEQVQATEEFKDALTRLKELSSAPESDLEKAYNKVSGDFNRILGQADAVRTRIGRVESVAADLFKEWEEEIAAYSSADLRAKSQRQLAETQERYSRLYRSMSNAEKQMDPVIQQFQDQVLFLKHNLNAQAIGSLQEEVANIELDVANLISEMERSIAEANEFIQSMPE